MPRLTLDKLRRSPANAALASAYYIHGGEGLLKDQALDMILDRALDPRTRDFNLDLLSAQQLEPAELAAACATLPMMAERRVVVVRDIEAWKRKSKAKVPATQYLERPLPDTVLVMVQGGDDDPDEDLASRATSIECTAPVGDELAAWLDDRLQQEGVTITPEAREHLLRATAGDLGLLATEISKLSGLADDGPISAATVAALAGIRFGETVDDWRDAVLRDDAARALALSPRLLELTGISGVRLVISLGSSLLVLRWARAAHDQRKLTGRALAEAVKRFCFEARPAVGSYDPLSRMVADVVGRWPRSRLKAAMAAALEADAALKNTAISDEAGIVADLILTLAASGAKRAA